MNTNSIRHLSLPLSILLLASVAGSQNHYPGFQKLRERLVCDGKDSTRMAQIFQDERVQFLPKLIPLNAIEREIPAAYSQFLTVDQVRDGFQYLNENREQINSTLQGTGVSPHVSIAILKIESDLGRKAGKYSIISSLATITLMADSLQWLTKYDTSRGANLEAMKRRAIRRSNWAYKELLQFLNVCELEGWDPVEITGSWAGAFGWAQFMPSSHLRCARDGDGDGKVNPFSLPDALASIICYLQEARWHDSPESHRRALMQYNPSSAYVDCVLEFARRLKEMEMKSPASADPAPFNR